MSLGITLVLGLLLIPVLLLTGADVLVLGGRRHGGVATT